MAMALSKNISNFVRIMRTTMRSNSTFQMDDSSKKYERSQMELNAQTLAATDTTLENKIREDRSIASHYVDVGGSKIHYDKTGVGKHKVLLMPGALGCARTDFKLQLPNMNGDLFTLIAWDPQGYGKSRPPNRTWPDHFFERDANDAAQLMKTIGYNKFSVLGWSDGGITGLILAARHPELVQKLVVWGSNSYVTKEETESYEQIRNIDNWSARMREPFVEVYGEEYFRQEWSNWVDALKRYYNQRGGDICKADLPKITCPTLIVHGQKDALVPQFHPDYLDQNIKNSKLINWPEGKHNLHMKYYKDFNSLVEQFLMEPVYGK